MGLQAFFDESGNSPDQQVLVIGGPVATYEAWKDFSDAWSVLRSKSPEVEYVKYGEVVRGYGQFHERNGWTEERRQARLAEFVDVICDHVIGFAWVGLSWDHFKKHVQEVPRQHQNLITDHLYPHAAILAVCPLMSLLTELGQNKVVDSVFDTTNQGAPLEDSWQDFRSAHYAATRDRPSPHIGKIAFDDEISFPPLQAADLIAGVCRHYCLTNQKPSGPFERLNELEWEGEIITENDIAEWGRQMSALFETMSVLFPSIERQEYDSETATQVRKRHKRELEEATRFFSSWNHNEQT